MATNNATTEVLSVSQDTKPQTATPGAGANGKAAQQTSGNGPISPPEKKKKTRAPKKPKEPKEKPVRNDAPSSAQKPESQATATADGNGTPENTSQSASDNQLPLRTQIMKQLEYYFSDENLSRDKFLQKEMEKDESKQGYVSLELLLGFNRIQKLTANLDELRAAVRESEVLKLSKSGQRVRRNVPFELPLTEEQQAEQRTVYVSYLPKTADKESVKGIFGICGNIKRIDLPLDKKTGEIKGIGFVEFEEKEQAKKTIKYFNDKNNDFYKLGMRVKAYSVRTPFGQTIYANNPESSPPVQHLHHQYQQYIPELSTLSATSSPFSPSPASPPLLLHQQNYQSPVAASSTRESVYDQAPTFNYTKQDKRKKRSGSKPEAFADATKWEPDPNTNSERPKLNLRPRSESIGASSSSSPGRAINGATPGSIIPTRQPLPPDGTRGFAFASAGRGKAVSA